MPEGPRVQVLADLAEVTTIRTELQELRSRCPERRASRIAARQNKNVFLGIDRDSCCFAKIRVRRKLQRIVNRVVSNDRSRLLCERRPAQQHEASHYYHMFH